VKLNTRENSDCPSLYFICSICSW